MSKTKPLIFIPTYNERDNVLSLCTDILNLELDVDILFMDDNSPDGTGEEIDSLAKRFGNVFTLHRQQKLGIGRAHQDGIRWAFEQGYLELITMDCDFTHPPSCIPEIIRVGRDGQADVVVGSRYLRKKSLAGWSPLRVFLTYSGHALTKTLLGISQDATGAFRYYRLDRVPGRLFDLVSSDGYSFFFESLHVLNVNGFKVAEIPITLPPRTAGHSKMDFSEVGKSIGLLLRLCTKTLLRKKRLLISEHERPAL